MYVKFICAIFQCNQEEIISVVNMMNLGLAVKSTIKQKLTECSVVVYDGGDVLLF